MQQQRHLTSNVRVRAASVLLACLAVPAALVGCAGPTSEVAQPVWQCGDVYTNNASIALAKSCAIVTK
jgi:hypothetical protein